MDINMYQLFSNMFAPILRVVYGFIYGSLLGALAVIVISFTYFCIKYKIKPYRLDKQLKKLENIKVRFKVFDMLRWLMWDWGNRKNWIDSFNEYGFTFFVGPQGSGKTISLVHYLNSMKMRYPKAKIVTNFKYKYAHHVITDWKELLTFRNGENGVIFAFDEMQNEWNTQNWRDMPPSIISTVSMQRKQFVKIVACSQVFNAVAKPLKDQCFTVIVCETFFKRWTFTREYDYAEYTACVDNSLKIKKHCRPLFKRNFVQSNFLRSCYDTREIITRLSKESFIERGMQS